MFELKITVDDTLTTPGLILRPEKVPVHPSLHSCTMLDIPIGGGDHGGVG